MCLLLFFSFVLTQLSIGRNGPLSGVHVPELPEVEAVRQALAPVMTGVRFDRVELRRGPVKD